MKYKQTHTSEFVVGGYTRGKGEREPLGALLLGAWNDGKLDDSQRGKRLEFAR